jgi:hypothetical protein
MSESSPAELSPLAEARLAEKRRVLEEANEIGLETMAIMQKRRSPDMCVCMTHFGDGHRITETPGKKSKDTARRLGGYALTTQGMLLAVHDVKFRKPTVCRCHDNDRHGRDLGMVSRVPYDVHSNEHDGRPLAAEDQVLEPPRLHQAALPGRGSSRHWHRTRRTPPPGTAHIGSELPYPDPRSEPFIPLSARRRRRPRRGSGGLALRGCCSHGVPLSCGSGTAARRSLGCSGRRRSG